MAEMREINQRLDEIEAHLWWLRWRMGLEIPPPPAGGGFTPSGDASVAWRPERH